MSINSAKIISIFDRLAHPSTTESDVMNTVAGLRRIMKGEMPSAVLGEVADLKERVRELSRQVSDLKQQRDKLEQERTSLRAHIQTITSSLPPLENRSYYTYDEVMRIMREKFGKERGGLKAWATYNEKLRFDDPSITRISDTTVQVWRRKNQYPKWAVQQLLDMPRVVAGRHKWTSQDIDFLCNLHLTDPMKTNDELAVACSKQFGCEINSNSIKTKLDMLRRQGRIARYRPSRHQ